MLTSGRLGGSRVTVWGEGGQHSTKPKSKSVAHTSKKAMQYGNHTRIHRHSILSHIYMCVHRITKEQVYLLTQENHHIYSLIKTRTISTEDCNTGYFPDRVRVFTVFSHGS